MQLEYTNDSSDKWRARFTDRWLDAEGRGIDGFSANETLRKTSAFKIARAWVSTLECGPGKTGPLQEGRFEP